MKKILGAILVTIVAIAIFLLIKDFIGLKLGLRTYWPAFAALFFYTYYLLSINQKTGKSEKSG